MYNYNTVSGEAAIAIGHAMQDSYDQCEPGIAICMWSLMCKMLCLLEKNTIDRQWIKTSVNQA
jgi:hypothetical protein